MSNIHLIATDKPSRLWVNNLLQGKLELSEEVLPYNTSQNIYITSDEEIKEGDWYFITESISKCESKYEANDLTDTCKKIILTTDQELISDGVQAIDDEFLEWFVKNPSCEEVEVVKEGYKNNGMIDESTSYRYKIIIPKEEPTMITDWLDKHGDPEIYKKVEKQLELEEAAERLGKDAYKKHSVKDNKLSLDEQIQRSGGFIVGFKEGFIDGAKWQAGRMYSEEDLLSAFEAGMMFIGEDKGSFREWFEQFKKS